LADIFSSHRHVSNVPEADSCTAADGISKAFSSEVDTGAREENASKQESGASVLIQSEPILL
jgi:hypothetical protein